MKMSDRRTIMLSAMMVTAGPVSMALLTPALPEMARHFNVGDGTIALTLTFYLIGFASGQLLVGPLADQFGRRLVALSFSGVYLLASIIALVAGDLHLLMLARLLQGCGVSSGLVISRAIVRDGHEGRSATRILSAINICNAVIPMVSPALGAFSSQYLGWRYLFGEMAVYGACLFLALCFFQTETLERTSRKVHFSPWALLRSYGDIFRNRTFVYPALIIGCAIGVIYVTSILLPFILMRKLGLSVSAFGFVVGLQTLSYFCASIVCTRLSGRLDARRLLGISIGCFVIAAVILAAARIFWPDRVLSYIVPVMIWVAGNAFCLPVLTVKALQAFDKSAGQAAALLGFFQIVCASLATWAIGLLSAEADVKVLFAFIPGVVAILILSHLDS